MREGKREEAEAAKEAVRRVNEQIEGLADRRSALDSEVADFMAHLPNIPCPATPVGKDESENPERRRWGTPRDFAAEASRPSRTGIWVPIWASLISTAARSCRARASRCSRARRSPGSRTPELLPEHAPRARVQGVHSARHREPRDYVRHGPVAQVRGRRLSHGRGPVPHSHGRGRAHQPACR